MDNLRQLSVALHQHHDIHKALGNEATEAKPETAALPSFHVTPQKAFFVQGDDINLRFLFHNNSNATEKICTVCKEKELFMFFFLMGGDLYRHGSFF